VARNSTAEGKFLVRDGSFMETPRRREKMRKVPWGDLALWVPTLFLVWVFAHQGVSKFSNESGWAKAFAAWHFPVWFRILIGACETAAAALLLARRTAPVGAALIALVMLGGMGTHIYWHQSRYITSEVVPLALSLLVLRGRWSHFARMISGWRREAP
jgi:uncharacterized membrane protein YphA (DoxX/SURF4 family)